MTRNEFTTLPALFNIIVCQGLPDWDLVQHKVALALEEAKKTCATEKDLRAFGRIARATRDFWEHVREEFSDHIQWTERNVRRLEKRHAQNIVEAPAKDQ